MLKTNNIVVILILRVQVIEETNYLFFSSHINRVAYESVYGSLR
jgi:hypothetical protein